MSVSAINGSSSAYAAYSGYGQAKTPGSPDKAALQGLTHRVTVEAVNTSTGAAESQSLQATPLAVAWAPQMYVQGDENNDGSLSLGEFQAQLARINVSAETAKQLFENFDTSGDGQVSLAEFVLGVSQSVSSGSQVFNNLLDSYTRDANGNFDSSAADQFLSAGASVAEAFWKSQAA
jgi:hypothetical protein